MGRKIVNKIGLKGEKIARMFLVKQGFRIVEINFNTYFGEIDIICQKGRKIHFVEVKTVSCVTSGGDQEKVGGRFSRETSMNDSNQSVRSQNSENTGYRAEYNVSREKIKRLERTINVYLSKYKLWAVEWQLDLIAVEICKGQPKRHLKDSFESNRVIRETYNIRHLEAIY